MVCLVDVDAGQPGDVRAGGDDDALGLELLLAAVCVGHLDLAGPEDRARAVDGVDLVLLEQEGDAVDVALHALVLEGQHLGEIELGRGHLDAHGGEAVSRFLEQLGGMQQRLGGDAADVEAGAAEGGALLHHGHLHAELRRADGAHVAARAGADDDQVVRSRHATDSSRNRCGSSRHSLTRTRKVTASLPSTMRWS